ncbi:MAG TPA: alpha-amylase family protein [Solirubrobacteraceae bacterium]|nr:alpha-amylase family protein [Solirubrobacteraceae bacterium]
MRRLRATFLAFVLLLACAPSARAEGPAGPETVLQDDAVLLHSDDAGVKAAMAQIKALGVDRVRLTAGWSVIAPKPDSDTRPDFDATDPGAYPSGAWRNLDRAVQDAHDAGLKVMIDIAFWAPHWATQGDAQGDARARTQIDPAAYAQFAQAVARRYSGSYAPPAPPAPPPPKQSAQEALLDSVLVRKPPPAAQQQAPPPAPLPAVDIFTLWNEPNQPGFLMPQWALEDGQWVAASADVYRAMVYAAYPAIKAVDPGARVLIGGTASMGSSVPGRNGVPPLAFIRRLACVDQNLQPVTTGACASFQPLPGDGWAHHPYSLRTLPSSVPRNPDDLPVSQTPKLESTLRALAAAGRIAPADTDLYMTEYGYETSPPDPKAVFGPLDQALLLSWAEYLGTRDPAVKMWPQFLLRDRPGDPAGPTMRPFGDWQTGLFYADGTAKPAAASFRTPTFAQCVRRGHGARRVVVWGLLRDGAQARVVVSRHDRGRGRARPRAWTARAVTLPAAAAGISRVAPWRRGATFRLSWRLPDGTQVLGPAVTPVGCPGSPRWTRHP